VDTIPDISLNVARSLINKIIEHVTSYGYFEKKVEK
jgi:hypothetical protein